MYQKPKLETFGSFRSLTQVGWRGGLDPFPESSIGDGCGVYTNVDCDLPSSS